MINIAETMRDIAETVEANDPRSAMKQALKLIEREARKGRRTCMLDVHDPLDQVPLAEALRAHGFRVDYDSRLNWRVERIPTLIVDWSGGS